jgi:imidazolonepropionase-like amidohydrolase
MTAKERIRGLVEKQMDGASYDEILRELAFERMIARGLTDARNDRVISNDEMGKRIRRWQSTGTIVLLT